MDDLVSVLQLIEKAHGLPNACYIDTDMHAKEADAIFKQGWAAIGFGCDVPKPGCVYPIDMLGIPLLMVRTKNDEVHVFENVCRHRGMILVEEPAQLNGPITCPYHAWSYDLEGHLKATPHVGGPNIHKDETVICESLSLNRVRSVVWRDVVFVNLSGTAAPFDMIAHPLRDRWSEFEKPIFGGGADSMFSLEVDCNWKLAVENYCEAYHLPFIHPGLNSYSRLEDHYNILDEEIYAGQGSYVYKPQLDEDGRCFPVFEGLTDKWDTAAEYCAFFPNVLFGVEQKETSISTARIRLAPGMRAHTYLPRRPWQSTCCVCALQRSGARRRLPHVKPGQAAPVQGASRTHTWPGRQTGRRAGR